MPGGVIEVDRCERPGWRGRLDPWPLLATLCIALRRGRATRKRMAAPPHDEPLAEAAPPRGVPVLVAEPDGRPRCVACGLCEWACPARCLSVLPGEDPADPASRRPERFTLDPASCLLCGLCEEACPEAAIVMSPVPIADLAGGGSVPLELDALLVAADRLGVRVATPRGERAAIEASQEEAR